MHLFNIVSVNDEGRLVQEGYVLIVNTIDYF